MPAAHELAAAEQPSAFLTKRAVLKLIPISDVTLWTWCRTGYFPAPRVIGSRTVWVAAEVYAFMESRPTRHYKGA